MAGASHLDWPFFTDIHRDLRVRAADWVRGRTVPAEANDDASRQWVRQLAEAGLLGYCVPAAFGGALDALDSRALCVLRETLAEEDALADFAFAMQGLGSGAITLGGTEALQREWLPRVARGEAIAALALSEPEAGSDVSAIRTRATRTPQGWSITGTKTWISNGGIADFYCVFARSDAASVGAKGISAFLVPARSPGVVVERRLQVTSPHPLATMRFDDCEVPDAQRLGDEGDGFKLAMRTLDIFRPSVGAAALGFARRALRETLQRANGRAMFGATLAAQPLAQAIIGDMATELDAAALLTYRAAWQRDTQGGRTTAVAAMAKLVATESAQRIVDRALQLHGAEGVRVGGIIERLYRDVRALRIYEGASEVQRLLIGRETLKSSTAKSGDIAP